MIVSRTGRLLQDLGVGSGVRRTGAPIDRGTLMHEMSIVASLLERVEAEARSREATAVHAVHVDVGELSGIEVDLLSSAYEMLSDTGLCAGVPLSVRRIPARWACPHCGATLEGTLRCAACTTPGRLVEGGEILLRTIEMEVRDV